MLESVGRFDESLPYWDLLVSLQPEGADAHLNLAITAGKAEQHQRSLDAADWGLAHFPGHARLLAVRAMALKNLDRMDDALATFEEAIAADPNRALTRYNQALTLRAAIRFEEASEAHAAAASLGLNGAEFHGNWAAAELDAGRVESAAELYRRALTEDPADKRVLQSLTRLKIEYLRESDGFDHYAISNAARGGSIESWVDWIAALSANNRLGQAAEVGHRSLAQHPGEPRLQALTGFADGMTGDAAAALELFDRLPTVVMTSPKMLIGKAQLALRTGEYSLASRLAEEFVGHEPGSQNGWAILGLAWRMTKDPRERWLCDYDRLVMITDVPSAGGLDAPAYARQVGDMLEPLHRSLDAPGNQSLREGTQTNGNLFDSSDPQMIGFRDSVIQAAERMAAALPSDPSHPFLSKKSARLETSGSWSVRLRAGSGHHVPHYHSQGWMSSAYYARFPDSDEQKRAGHQGWIHFGMAPDMFKLDIEPRRLVEPKPGRLVLFPSYFLHGTMPFSAGDRLTAAFDFVPV